ncbi:hypothetical protein [Halobaculum sp. MBLA0143]|uniref:hypothetical protein n=1 Tax=Halobaculum sp. MBLA0143 TaxID=3079933 RepID=UPI00352431E0
MTSAGVDTGDDGSERHGRPARLARSAITVLVPVAGVVGFGWRLDLVLSFYWLEVGTGAARLLFEATLAARPNSELGSTLDPPFRRLREKRGGIQTPGLLPPIHPHALPTVATAGLFVSLVWLLAGAGVIAFVGADVIRRHAAVVLLGAVGVTLGELVALLVNLRRRPYADLSPAAVVRLRQFLAPAAFLFLVVVVVFGDGGPVDAGVPVAVVVCGRTLVGVADTVGLGRRLLPARMQPEARIGDRDPVPAGRGAPTATWRVDRRSVVAARALTGPGRVLLTRAGLLVGAIAVFVWLVLDGTAGVVAAAGILAGVAVVGAASVATEADLLYGHLEYRLYDDCLVAYDRLLETPQWRVDLADVTEVETGAAVLDGVSALRLQRLAVRGGEHSGTLVGLADAEAVRERIDEARFE